MSALEDRYRRWLRWYPAEHRRAHEEEMLGVLLAAAGPDQTRPAVRDVLDLVRGGLGIRIRRAPGALARGGRRDATALLGVIAPLLLLAGTTRYAAQAILSLPDAAFAATHGSSWWIMYHSAPSHLAWGIAAVVALCGAPRATSAAVLAAVVLNVAVLAANDDYAGAGAAAPLLLGLIAAGALLAGPGAARGREVLGRPRLIGIVVLLAVAVFFETAMVREALGITWGAGLAGLAGAALVATAWLARGAAGRRALVALAVPLLPIMTVPYYPGYVEDPLARCLITMVAVPAVTGLVSLVALAALELLVIRPVTARRRRSAG
jgi:hypothetical protein